jgi:hypothetical protein
VETVALIADFLLKPLLQVLFNGVLQPVLVFLLHVGEGLDVRYVVVDSCPA